MSEQNHQGRAPSGGAPKARKKRAGPSAGAIALAVGKVLGTLILVGICTCAILACFASVYIKSVILPQTYVDASTFKMNLSSTIFYTDPDTGENRELRTLHGDENRVLVDYADIPQDLVHAVVAIEDERFYQHHGVDWKRTAGAFVNMFLGMKNTYGGSTLTQQLIKNMTDKDEVTVQRKILEIFRALEFERNYSKEDILEMYLNYIYLGESCYGVGTASYTYFGKDVSQLSLAECASLIGITNNPSAYDPYISDNTRNNNKERQELVLWKMKELGYITEEEMEAAKAEPLQFQRGEDESRPVVIYSYYEDEIIRDVIDDLKKELDVSETVATQMVYNGGLSIYSCYNPKVQACVDAIYNDRANLDYTSASGQPLQSAITVIDNATGNVVALAGGVGEKEGSLTQNRAVKTIRPPGSSIKPLAVYAPALEMGVITPATVIDDSPYNLNNGGWPINSFTGYRGLTTVYEGLQNSVNTVAVKIMANYITPQIAFDFLTKNQNGMGGLGISTNHLVMAKEINGTIYSDIDVAPMALGGLTNGVSTLEMAAAYSTFARAGVYVEPRTYTQVKDNDGNVLLEKQQETHTAMKESTAWYINYLLKNAAANGTGRGAANDFGGMSVAGKTGTTSSRKDLWFAGYTPYYTAVVWTGYDQQERLATSLQNPSVGLWNKVMSKVHEGLENRDFPEPTNQSVVSVTVCKDSGKLPTPECKMDARGGDSRMITLKFISGEQPSEYCDKHTQVEICLSDPFLNAKGEKSGMFHLAGEFCPENTAETPGRRTVSVVDWPRNEAESSVVTRDHFFMKAYLDELGDAAYCTVHTSAPEPEPPIETEPPAGPGGSRPIDPYDETTWPTDYPGFNPFDPTTWPSQPSDTTPEPTPTPEATPPSGGPDLGIPIDPPYIPAGG